MRRSKSGKPTWMPHKQISRLRKPMSASWCSVCPSDVTFAVALQHRSVRVPASAVITDARGVHVARVDGTGRVQLVAVQRGLDNGREIELVDGLEGGEQILANPGGAIPDGMRVEAVR